MEMEMSNSTLRTTSSSIDYYYDQDEDRGNFTAAVLAEAGEMPLGIKVFWDLLFGASIFISIVGNFTVLWIILGISIK